MVTNFEVTGLKTGSTSLAKYCLSATGRKDGVDLIAVILAAPDYKTRFADAVTLLIMDLQIVIFIKMTNPGSCAGNDGGRRHPGTGCRASAGNLFLPFGGRRESGWNRKRVDDGRILQSAGSGGRCVGHLVYRLDGRELGSVEIEAAETVEKAGLWDYFKKVMGVFAA